MNLHQRVLASAFFLVCSCGLQAANPQFPNPVSIQPDGTIHITPLPNGDRIPDFSTVGFHYGNTPLPGEQGGYDVPVLVTLEPGTGDQTDRIQAAIDFLSGLPLINGFRGAVLLKAGRWEMHSVNRIRITASGVVIRGEGDHPLTGTRLYAIGTTNENQSGNTRNSRLIAFDGGSLTVNASARTLVDDVYIPGGTNVIPITGHSFMVGQRIQVRWPGSVAWQQASYYNRTATADLDPAITFNRIVTAVTADSITLDAPITSPLDPSWGRGYVVPVTAFNYITNVGVSDIYFESAYSSDTDENHVWNVLDFTEVEDGFVNRCTARHFAYSIAYVNTSTRKITINRSQCHDGISILQGGRRYSFVLTGEMGLVSNNTGRNGRHTFSINWPAAPGPNVFVDGVSTRSFNESGSHARWNNGGLWDNISELNASVGLQVKLERPSAFCVAWNVVTNTITFENMPLSPNWSFGTTAVNGSPAAWRNSTGVPSSLLGKAEAWSNGTRMPARSLYAAQLEARLRDAKNPHTHQANLPVRINLPPTIRTPSQLVVLSGSSWSYQLPVSNVVAAITTPNYSATGLPAGLSINATTGLISGTVPTVATETNYNVTLSARNQDGTTTKSMTLTVRPAGSPKIPLSMSLEVDMQRTTPLLIGGIRSEITSPIPVPMVPASRLLAPMIVRKSYTSDINGTAYTLADIPVPVRGVLPIEGLTSPVNITYNGSTTLPTAAGVYNVVATLVDPIYEASASGQLLITNAGAVTVTLGNTSNPTPSNPVTATSSQPSIPPVITYDGSPTFPTAPGQYAAKAIVANPDFFGSRIALISVGRANATLTIDNLTRTYDGSVQKPTVTTNPPGLSTRVSIHGQGILPGTYSVTAWIDDPNYSYTPVVGNMTIIGLVISTPGNLTVSGNPLGAVVNFDVSASTDGFTSTIPAIASPPSGSLFPVGTTTVNVSATDSNNQTWNKSFTVTVFPGPSQLQQINPSAGVTPGTVEILSPNSVRIVGAGGTTAGGATADLWTGTNDSNTYLSMPWQGDGIFTARLASFTSADSSAKAGIIFRETTLAGSRHSTIHLLPSGSVNFQHKTATGGASSGTNFFNGSVGGVGIPEWIRMVRQGDTFTMSYSENGTTWTELSSRNNVLSGSTLSVGFVVAPRTGNTTATAIFDNISFMTPAPVIGLPSPELGVPAGQSIDIDLSVLASTPLPSGPLGFSLGASTGGTVVLLADGRTARFTASATPGSASFDFTAHRPGIDPGKLVFLYDYENDNLSSGLISDRSGQNLPAAYESVAGGSAALVSDVPPALAGRGTTALEFREDGTTAARLSRSLTGTDIPLADSGWTFATWVRRDSTSTNDFVLYLGSGDGFGGSGDELHLHFPQGANTVRLAHYSEGTGAANVNDVSLTSPATAVPGVWHHLAVTYTRTATNPGTFQLFLNGLLAGTSQAVSWTPKVSSTNPLRLGGCHDTSATAITRHLHGALDDTALFRRALSASEIARLATFDVATFTGLSTTATLPLTIHPSIFSWRQTHFGTSSNTGNAADGFDFDGDGVTNLIEYALGTLPDSASSRPILESQISNLRLRITFFRARPDVTYTVEGSSNLSPDSWQIIATNPGQVGEEVIVTDPESASPSRFLRLRVAVP